jgi:putative isomerase
LNIIHTAQDKPARGQGYFTDQGSWMGFTIPENDFRINGFCGPFDLDHRQWISHSFIQVGYTNSNNEIIQPEEFVQKEVAYYPGRAILKSTQKEIEIEQTLIFLDARNTMLRCKANQQIRFYLKGRFVNDIGEEPVIAANNILEYKLASGEVIVLTFPQYVNLDLDMDNKSYTVNMQKEAAGLDVVISYFNTEKDYVVTDKGYAQSILSNGQSAYDSVIARWNGYITKNLRDDMPESYNRIMVKCIMTLISNWRSAKGGLLHDGVVPSHAMGYFVGFWAWDSWKHAVALAHIEPELAKNQIRTMFDYQSQEGMIADCIYTDTLENNWRDSKPPLAVWAVNEIYNVTGDKAFLEEMYPCLVKYHKWWYQYRDHDKNRICEFGATDGTLEAAKWESGMDNAIRFDDAQILKNSDGAWSFDQESVDLNAYLCYEQTLLAKLASVIGATFDVENKAEIVREYFFDKKEGYFYDRQMNGDFIREQGPEGWTPLWTSIATKEQAKDVIKIMFDTTKFSTYIPFPTVAADNPKFLPEGYWRGPIWLDQVYFAIAGLRKYNYVKEADNYTDQVFTRLDGLNEDKPIHENYDTNTGKRLKAPHFSWSSAHLFMMYRDYGKNLD